MLLYCFAVKVQKYFVNYETLLDFPSAWEWVDNDWTSIFGWTCPFKGLSWQTIVIAEESLADINDITYTWHTGSPLISQAGWCLLKQRQSADNKELRDLILPSYIQRRKETENLPLKMRKVVCGRSSNQCSPLRRALTTDTCMSKTTTRTFGVDHNWAVQMFCFLPSI